MKILLLTRYGKKGASSRYRSYQYIPFLLKAGFKITVLPLLNDYYLEQLYENKRQSKRYIIKSYFRRISYLLKSSEFDLIWIEKEALPWIPSWVELYLIGSKTPYIVDYDDALFHRYDTHQNIIIRNILGKKIDNIMKHSKLVIAGNRYLAERAEMSGAERIEILPTVIDLEKYPKNDIKDKEYFTIGWIGTPTTAKYLISIHEVLKKVSKDEDVNIALIGSGTIDLPEVNFNVIKWSDDTEVEEMQKFDVGIMPLPNEPWERGKNGFKLIQYMGCSLPVVASPVGVNKKIVEHNKNGFIASTDEEWLEALYILKDNYQLRKKMGIFGREKVEREYSIQVIAPKLIGLINTIIY